MVNLFSKFPSSTKIKMFFASGSINVFFLGAIVGISIISAWTMIKDVSTIMADFDIRQHAPPKPTKFYAIHIGPSKTGTLSIQASLRNDPFEINTLGEDNLIYVGGGQLHLDDVIRKIKQKSITPKLERDAHREAVDCMAKILEEYYSKATDIKDVVDRRLEIDENLRESLRLTFVKKCWAPHKSKIEVKKGKASSTRTKQISFDATYMLDYSMLDISEEYSWFTSDFQALGMRFRMFDILGYEKLVVVGTYRRLAEWKLSTYNGYVKGKCLKTSQIEKELETPCPDMKKFLNTRTGNDFGLMHSYSSGRHSNIHFTIPEILEAGPAKLVGKILNFAHLGSATDSYGVKRYQSITTELYCNVLGMELTPNACLHGQSLERQASNSGVTLDSATAISKLVNKEGEITDTIYKSIVAAGHRLGFIIPSFKELEDCQKVKDKYWCTDVKLCVKNRTDCDEIAETRHKELQKINLGGNITIVPQGTSIKTWKDLSDYHAGAKKLTWFKTMPVACPSTKWLETYLDKSLEFEELAMPEFYASPLGNKEHRRLFWDVWVKEKKLFCHVNITSLFHNVKSWDEIINDRIINYDWDGNNRQVESRVAMHS